MPYRMQSRWVSYENTPLFGINLDGFGNDRQRLQAEIEAVEAILRQKERNTVLAVVDLALTGMSPEVIAFLQAHAGQQGDPIRKMAIIGISSLRRVWYRLVKKVAWPRQARFFDEHEKAKPWLLSEQF
jgi:hypothetical protein